LGFGSVCRDIKNRNRGRCLPVLKAGLFLKISDGSTLRKLKMVRAVVFVAVLGK
jgi:hypothetical protein